MTNHQKKFWKKFKAAIYKKFDIDPAFNEKFIKAKKNLIIEKTNTIFHNNKIPKKGTQCICLSVVLIDSIFRTGNNYHPQVFLEECKYVVKEKKMLKYIIDKIEILTKKFLVKKFLMKKILMKKMLMKKIKKIPV